MKNLIVLLPLFCLFTSMGFGQENDSSLVVSENMVSYPNEENSDDYDESQNFSPGLAFFALIGIGFILIGVGAGIALTVIGLLIIFGLISLGILSTSVLIGIYKKSYASGFKVFLLTSTTFAGFLLCGIGFWLMNKFLHWWTAQTAITIGAGIGILTGLVFGLVAFFILRRFALYLKNRLQEKPI